MIISIASGKGGTGKTTVATNLAFSLGAGVQLLDCDVEEPNAHLFLNLKIDLTETVYLPVPEIDLQKCDFCGQCAAICRFKAIAILGKKNVLTFPELCHSCGGCLKVCPRNAISETGRELGIIEKGSMGPIDFVHGRLRIGEAMSPPLIEKVRSYIKPDRINLIDAPPGTSCPVIAAMKDTDFVLMVTEPTPFGLHDLKLAVEAVRLLEIPHGLVINRSTIGTPDVRSYAEENRISILMEIPFERRIAEAYSNGRLIAEVMPEWKSAFADLYARIEGLAAQGKVGR